jgi:hypothetical protein
VQRPLDSLCDQVLNAVAAGDAHGPGLRSAHGIREALRDFVGDVTEMAEAEASSGAGPNTSPHARSAAPTGPTIRFPFAAPVQPASAPGPAAGPVNETRSSETHSAERRPSNPRPAEPPATAPPTTPVGPRRGPAESSDLPTQAGVPIFDDENDEVSWLSARPEKPPPPPPFEEPPDRPLFAPEPPEGRPIRTPRQGAPAVSQEFWPWDAGTGSGVIPAAEDEDEEVPGRSWMRLAAAVAGACLLLIAIVFAFNLGRGRSPLGSEPDPSSQSSGATPSSTAAPITGISAVDLDPQGDPPEENRELAPLAVDGDPSTAWRTVTYEQDLGPTGLKTGVGLRLDLGSPQEVSAVDLTFVGAPSEVSLYLSDDDTPGVAGQDPVATVTAKEQQRVTLDEPTTGRYLTVWFTSLPAAEGGYRGEIAEVVVRG